MNKKLLIAGLVSGIFAFVLGFIIWGVLLADFSAGNTYEYPGLAKEEMDLVFIFLSCLVWGFFISWIYLNFSGKKTVLGGALTGLITGLMVAASADLSLYSMWNLYTPVYLATDTLVNGLYSGCIGAAAGFMLKSGH